MKEHNEDEGISYNMKFREPNWASFKYVVYLGDGSVVPCVSRREAENVAGTLILVEEFKKPKGINPSIVYVNNWTTIRKEAERRKEAIDTLWRRIERMKKKGIGEGEEYLTIPEWGITVVKAGPEEKNK